MACGIPCVYSVYDTKTTLPVIIDGTAEACAKVMGMTLGSFYCALHRAREGKLRGWEIYPRRIRKSKRGVKNG